MRRAMAVTPVRLFGRITDINNVIDFFLELLATLVRLECYTAIRMPIVSH